jgi:hypothetical protein
MPSFILADFLDALIATAITYGAVVPLIGAAIWLGCAIRVWGRG